MNGNLERPKGVGWVCFHCGERFLTPGAAEIHFGASQFTDPACRIKASGEFGLVVALRAAEVELERYRAEDSDKDRELAAMAANHYRALQAEEEKGYARGLADARGISSPALKKIANGGNMVRTDLENSGPFSREQMAAIALEALEALGLA